MKDSDNDIISREEEARQGANSRKPGASGSLSPEVEGGDGHRGARSPKRGAIKALSPKEEAIMSCFWQQGPMFVREVVEMLPEPKPHFNTVSTFVRSLEAKGWLSHEQIGNSYRYFSTSDGSEYRDRSLRGLVNRFFGNSYLGFVSALVSEEKITTDELRELIEKIESQRTGEG